ncbi:MAG: hypothetical protein GF353_13995 [Candidatus Lokiarchaeota archaeon]|nr:hypothetical protein [Candidatus Lokiarchaeota archaeon]
MDIILKLFKFIFVGHSVVAITINSVIIAVSIGILFWIIIQLYNIRGAFRKFSKFKRDFQKLDEKEKTKEKIDEFIKNKKYRHPWLLKKIDTVKKLKDDTNATIDAIDNIDSNLRWITYGILRYPTSSLIILGLLGTIAGLQKAIYSFLPAIRTGKLLNLEAVRNVMLGTLEGMQTAFSTTLAGLFCSIILGFIISLGIKGYFDRYITAAKSFLVETLIPLYSVLEASNLQTLTDQTKELKTAVADLAEQSNTLFQPIVESANSLNSGINKIFAAAQTYVKVTDSIEKLNSNLEGNLDILSNSLKGVMTSIDKYSSLQTDIENTLKEIASVPQQFKEYINSLNTEFKNQQDILYEQHNKIVKEQLDALIEATDSMSKRMETFQEEADKTKEALKDAAEKGVGDLMTEVEKVIKQVGSTSTKIVDANKSLDITLANVQKSQKEHADQYLNAYKKQYESIQSSLNEFFDNFKQDQVFRNKQVIDAVSSWATYNQFLSKLLKDMDSLPTKIAKAVREGNGRSTKTKLIKE